MKEEKEKIMKKLIRDAKEKKDAESKADEARAKS